MKNINLMALKVIIEAARQNANDNTNAIEAGDFDFKPINARAKSFINKNAMIKGCLKIIQDYYDEQTKNKITNMDAQKTG